jgi:DNA-binding transcriptional LysR family regulator
MIVELRTLIAVAKYGTFAGAGERLGLTQSAISGHMKRLEAELGFTLFDRTGRSALLNAAGLRTLDRAKEITALFDALGKEPADAELEGRLQIGAITSAQSTVLARALAAFALRFPNLVPRVVPDLSINLLNRMDAGELDVAVIIKPPFWMPPEMNWRPLFDEPYIMICAPDSVGDDWRALLREEPFVRYERTSFGGRQVDRFLRSHDIAVRDAVELDDVPAMISMVRSGLGVALVPCIEAHQHLLDQVRAIPLGAETFLRTIGVVTHRDKDLHHHLRFLVDCLADAALPSQKC